MHIYDTNMGTILYLMAVREEDVAYRACCCGTLPTKQRILRWTVAEEAAQMVHIFDDLSTVRFDHRNKGRIRGRLAARASVSCSDAYSFYYMYHGWDQWDTEMFGLFTELLYLRAVKLAKIATGIRMDYEWLSTTLYKFANRYNDGGISLNREPKELTERIMREEFDPTAAEIERFSETFPDLDKALDETLTNMYGIVYTNMRSAWFLDN